MLRRTSFRDLQVWQRGKAICVEVYKVTQSLPEDEKFGMVSQLRRAAISIPSNIAEGHGRSTNADFSRFLYVSLGSVREVETLLEIGVELGYFGSKSELLPELDELAKMLSSLIHKLGQT